MTTITAIDYALLAGASYYDTRADTNRFPVLSGWNRISRFPTSPSGFEASAFGNGASIATSTDIVISFAGTYPQNPDGSILPIPVDIQADLALAAGTGSAQLLQAADYYLNVRASADPSAKISFTGHSLGGGLASLLAVFFGESAQTFDQAPFLNSATNILVAQNLKVDLIQKESGNIPADKLAQLLAPLDAYITALDPTNTNKIAADTLAGRQGLVSNINIQGEFLSSWYGVPSSNRIGSSSQPDIPNSNGGVSGLDLHSQALLTAFLQSSQAAAQGQALNDVTVKLPDLLKMIFDSKLYYNDPNNTDATAKENFLEHIVKHQATVIDPATGTTDNMVSRFTSDLWKIAQDGGLSLNESNGQPIYVAALNNVSKALTAFAMQKYYEEQAANPGVPSSELFANVTGGIQFDIASVSQKIAAAFQAGKEISLADAKGYQYFEAYIDGKDNAGQTSPYPAFNSSERTLIKSVLPTLRDWYVQAGANGMLATDTLNRGAFMLGGTGSDALVGGAKADLLVGNAGDDTLNGGDGNDTLLGGSGNDTYAYQTTQNSGLDTILDSDGNGQIKIDNTPLGGGQQFGDNKVFRGTDANGQSHLYTFVTGDKTSGGDLIVDGSFLIKNYNPNTGNHLGITLGDAVADVNPVTTRDIVGDFGPMDFYDANGNLYYQYDDLNNLVTDPNKAGDRADTLNGSAGNDHIMSGGGNDTIHAAQGGNDLIETGAGRDWVQAGSGNNVIAGGADGDILIGGTGNDRLYADTQIDTATAIANGNIINSGSGLQGDWLASGDDTLVGSSANDVLSGGGGSDLLIGGAGNDDILGDTNYVATSFDWTVTDTNGDRKFSPVLVLPAVGGADVIYAEEGNDHVWGEGGNDVVQAAEADMAKTTNGAICAVLFGGAKPEAANDSMLLAA